MRKFSPLGLVLAVLTGAASWVSSAAAAPPLKWNETDLGLYQSGTFSLKLPFPLEGNQTQIVAKGIAIRVGAPEDGATVLFDSELLRFSAGWTGGFVTFPGNRGGLEGQVAPAGRLEWLSGVAPGWGPGQIGTDPRPAHQGHLPSDVAHYRGLYISGSKVVLRYLLGTTEVLESPGYETRGTVKVFTRTLTLAPTKVELALLVGSLPAASTAGEMTASGASLLAADANHPSLVAAGTGLPAGGKWEVSPAGQLILRIPALPKGATFQIALAGAPSATLPKVADLIRGAATPQSLAVLCQGGPAHWPQTVETVGKLGTGEGPYYADEITLPEDNPYKAWMRLGGHDFLPNGDAVVANLGGDVWQVSGLDEKLEKVRWKRIATGLFQPLGCKVVEGKIYILGRDQITRLQDLNGDGEIDFYENFNNDCIVAPNYHEFALDLQTDRAGNFYYAKGSPFTPVVTSPHQGCMMKVSKDGRKLEVIATGLRAPNGLGMSPEDVLTCSDNQGHWMPTNRLNIIKPGGFYGMVPSAHRVLEFTAANGETFSANPSEAAERAAHHTDFFGPSSPRSAGYDLPLCWIPMAIDNSSGGQVWVPPGQRWGPLAGQMLQMSYGKCTLFSVVQETVDGVAQGGLVTFPMRFSSGIMRGRFNPKDGQLYVSGLNVWQSSASKPGCFYRVRYAGEPVTIPRELHAKKEGLQIVFTGPLEQKSATDPQNYSVERWNYAWTGSYGSPDIGVINPAQHSREKMTVQAAHLSADGQTLTLEIPDMAPCMQMKVKYSVNSAAGKPLTQEINHTIHRLPGVTAAVGK